MNEQNLKLIELNAARKAEFLEMAADYLSAREDRYKQEAEDFDAFLERLEKYRTGKNLPAGHVPSTTYSLLAGDKLIGRGDLRHRLSETLAVLGGHIGYDVRPTERRKGFGSLILKLMLEKARELGLDRVFLTCNTDNIASAKIIEKHGGKLENQMIYEPTGKLISHYWIEL